MSIAVNSILPVVNAQGVASEVAFQPGSVIAGRVLSVSPDNQARIAIGHSTIDVQSQVPLKAGQVLQFAVSKSDDGNVRLAVVTPQTNSAGGPAGSSTGNATLAPDAPINLANTLATSKIQLTPLEAQAVSTATQAAVTQQASLATLFANLGAVTSLQGLPKPLQQAVAELLAQRPPLDAKLTGDEVKSAFQNSGLFLESSLAKGELPSGPLPDMKAALIVLRQALTAALGTTGDIKTSTPSLATGGQEAATPANGSPAAVVTSATTQQAQNAAAAMLVPSLLPKGAGKTEPASPGGSGVADDLVEAGATAPINPAAARSPEGTARPPANGLATSLQQQALKNASQGGGSVAQMLLGDDAMAGLLSPTKSQIAAHGADGAATRSSVPPPPLRGGLPTAQPMALPSLPANASIGTTVHHLLTDTDAALARQTLLQVASLPDRNDAMAGPRLDQAAPRWSFEIPFAMPNGTAVAQFEISRDGGGGSEADAAQRVWRARFSLDVEPAGPVHALVSLTGEKTSVRIWAERPATAQQLQAGAGQLTLALARANLQPGEIVVREGAPVQAAPASAGHFLDRAL